MSGVRRRTKYRKGTMRSVEDEFPEPAENECIVRAMASRGNNLFEVRVRTRRASFVRLRPISLYIFLLFSQ